MARKLVEIIVFTRDRHPPNHSSFVSHGGPWPVHCVDGTPGFELHPEIRVPRGAVFIDKATAVDRDAYSGFDHTTLLEELTRRKVRRVVVCGLATDYCVRATALDAVKAGFETWLLADAVAGVEARPGDTQRAILEMRAAGVLLSDSGQITTILRHSRKPTAVLVVDLQRDFCEGGALPVPGAEEIVGPVNALLEFCESGK